jgi:DNA-binding IclR family transcriptional regulator
LKGKRDSKQRPKHAPEPEPEADVEMDPQDSAEGQRYRAPALEKGLDVLELLASESQPMAVSEIVTRLGRSTGELFRMIQVLEYRNFIEQVGASGGYRLTGRLFMLGLEQLAIKSLIEVALPVMRQLARSIGPSCPLAIHSEGRIVVVGRIESSEQLGFSVRIGYSKSIPLTVSGMILYAFQTDAIRAQWERQWEPALKKPELLAFRKRADEVRLRGFERAPSGFVTGITDISAPILRGELCTAALTVPFVHTTTAQVGEDDAVTFVKNAAKEISGELLHGD